MQDFIGTKDRVFLTVCYLCGFWGLVIGIELNLIMVFWNNPTMLEKVHRNGFIRLVYFDVHFFSSCIFSPKRVPERSILQKKSVNTLKNILHQNKLNF